MKKLIFILFFLTGIAFSIHAQDVITLKSGDEIKAKVLDIDLTMIKYKKFDNQAGPSYTIEKNKVFMIRYENGTKDVFNDHPSGNESSQVKTSQPEIKISINKDQITYKGAKVLKNNVRMRPNEVKSTFSSNFPALKKYKSGRTCRTISWVLTGLGAVDLSIAVINTSKGIDAKSTFAFAGLECASALFFDAISSSMINKSVKMYNSGNKTSLNWGVTKYGIGLCYNF